MQRSDWHILDYFHTYIQGAIYPEIERCIQVGADNVVALALLSYTEYLGGLISGTLGLNGKSRLNFKKALEYFPTEYNDIDSSLNMEYTDENGKRQTKKKGIYDVFRCGLAHEYFIKGFPIIYNNPDGHTNEHIGILRKEHIIEFPVETGLRPYPSRYLEFHANEYFRDFKAAVGKIIKLLLVDRDEKLLKGFNESLDRIRLRRIVVEIT